MTDLRRHIHNMERGIAARSEYTRRLEVLVADAYPNIVGHCARCQGSGYTYSEDYNEHGEWDRTPCPACDGQGLISKKEQ